MAIQAKAQTQTVKLKGGGTVTVREVKRSKMIDLMAEAKFNEENDGSKLRFAALLCRWAIIDCDIEGVTFKADRVKPLGALASEDVFDALADDDVAAIVEAAVVVEATEEDKGN